MTDARAFTDITESQDEVIMSNYAYAFAKIFTSEEVFFKFPKFPEVISSVSTERFQVMSANEVEYHLADALITALQARISARLEIPSGDRKASIKADGFIVLTVVQAMKLELAQVYFEQCRSVSEFSRKIGRQETAARRLFDLRHPSTPQEIEDALAVFGKRLMHQWSVEADTAPGYSSRQTLPTRSDRHARLLTAG